MHGTSLLTKPLFSKTWAGITMKTSPLTLHPAASATTALMESWSRSFKNLGVVSVVFSLLLIGLLYVFVFLPFKDERLFSSSQSHPLHPSTTVNNMTMITKTNLYKDELDQVLAETSTGNNKTVIIATVNKAYVEVEGVDKHKSMLDLFMDGLWLGEDTRGLRDHLLIVAVDQTAYERCVFLRLHCYKLETDGVEFSGEKMFMSEDFIKMMWRRTLFLGDVLKRGHNFIFTDTDVLWLRNPFSRLSPNETIDLQISTDRFKGNEWSQSNRINTGFYMVRSNNKTVALFDSWYAMKENSTGMTEQDVLAMLKRKGTFRSLGLRVRFLDTLYFSGFCQDSKDVGAVVTVHANCCRSISAKLADLTTVIHDWKRLKSSSTNETSTFRWSKHMTCKRSWKINDTRAS